MSKLSQALKSMTQAKHIGKLVLETREDEVEVLPPGELVFPANRSFLITGGASGFGLQMADLCVRRGARHLVLASRSGAKTHSDIKLLEKMRSEGAQIELLKLDLIDEKAVLKALTKIAETQPPLIGVIHAAGIIDDVQFSNMTDERFLKVFRPKAIGAWNLHRAMETLNLNPDIFLLLSSFASITGTAGQSNYVAANCFLNQLALYRRNQELAAQAICLGALGNYAGMLRDNQTVLELMKTRGSKVLPLQELLEDCERLIIKSPIQQGLASIDWFQMGQSNSIFQKDIRFAELIASQGSENRGQEKNSLLSVFQALEEEHRSPFILSQLTGFLSHLLEIEAKCLPLNKSFNEMALDSLLLNQLRFWILSQWDIDYPIMMFFDGQNLTQMAQDLTEQIQAKLGPG